jgi:esterase/lipase superfamily enzyme
MGARGVSQALSKVAANRPDLRKKIGALILASPDIPKSVFKTQVAPRLSEMAASVTTYVSAKDKALLASQKFNGAYALGDARDGVAVFPAMTTVDATNVDTDFLGHSYFGSDVRLLRDIRAVVAGASMATRPIRKAVPAGAHFCFPKVGQNSC